MKGTLMITLLALSLVWSGAVLAQQQQGSMTNQGQQSGQQGILQKAESLKGSTVIDPQGQELGKVDSVTIDMMSGQISYVVVDPERGNKHIPVPYNIFGLLRNGQLVLNVDKNKLDAAPSYAKSDQANWSNPQWAQQVASFWGAAPAGITTAQGASGASGSGQQASATSSSAQPPTSSQPTPMGSQSSTDISRQPMGSQGTGTSQPMGSSSGTSTETGSQPMGSSGSSASQPGGMSTETSPSTSSPSSTTTTQQPMDTTTQQPATR